MCSAPRGFETVLRQSLVRASWRSNKRHMFLKVAPTPNPNSLKFFALDAQFLERGRAIDFRSRKPQTGCSLVDQLFLFPGIKSVMIGEDYVTVTKDPTFEWSKLSALVFQVITKWELSGQSLLKEGFTAEGEIPSSGNGADEIVQTIIQLIETKIQPMVQKDGGNVRFVAFKEGVVYVLMQGACEGCSSSSITLNLGVARMLKHYVEEVKDVKRVDQEEADAMVAESGR
jgi:Fe-S cluster biogenesis protein NfuA